MTEHKQPPTANSLQEIITFVESLDISRHGAWFRGHSDSTFELLPSVFRKTGKNGDASYYNENELLSEFLRRHPVAKDKHSNTLELLTYAQHYGLPTRLLDWTENLLVATYFACCEFDDKDGELFIRLNPKNFDFLSLLYGDLNKNLIDLSIESTSLRMLFFQFHEIIKKREFISKHFYINIFLVSSLNEDNFHDTVGKSKEFIFTFQFDDFTVPHNGSSYDYHPPIINKRLAAQSGCFTVHSGKVFGGEAAIPFSPLEPNNAKNSNLISLIIPHNAKRKILKTLKMCGIDKGRLFPELEHQTAVIKELCKF